MLNYYSNKKSKTEKKKYIFLDNKLIKYKSIKFKLKFYHYKMKIITLRINEFPINFQNSTFIMQKNKNELLVVLTLI